MPEPKRIVLTGGPCAGKTTALSYIPEKLSDYGFAVTCVPEVATFIINSGLSPVQLLKLKNRKRYLEFEELMIRTQMIFEDQIFSEVSRIKGGKKRVIIFDRGCMDMSAYMGKDEFEMLLEKNRWNLVDLRDRRYDAIIHLVTVADGKEEFYTKENNAARYETAEQARQTDKLIQHSWLGHSHLSVIDNSTNFEGKMKRLLKTFQHILGIPVSLEIERKFLVSVSALEKLRNKGIPYRIVEIEQVYLNGKNVPGVRIRKRSQNGRAVYYQTFKIPTSKLSVREEREEQIDAWRYAELMEKRDASCAIIKKQRVCFLWNNQYFELDIFLEPERLKGLTLLEIELTEENDKVEIPNWLVGVKEVTGDPNFSNYFLSKSGSVS